MKGNKKWQYNRVYCDLVNLLGERNMLKIHEQYNGQQVHFPKRLYSQEYILKFLEENYNGRNLKIISRELGYSERWLQHLIAENLSKN